MNKAAAILARWLNRWPLTRPLGDRLALAAFLADRGAPRTYGAGQGTPSRPRRRRRRTYHQDHP